jgi:RNA polymerase sigma-70 factor, ECF subfamily
MDKFEKEFRDIYIKYFPPLFRFAKEFVPKEEAENIVQDVFAILWEKRNVLKITTPSGYYYSLVRNKCIDFLRHQSTIEKNQIEYSLSLEALQEMELEENDSPDKILQQRIESLPEKCRQIFILSKIEKKKHKEIASLLGISVSTIETQIAIALKKIIK